MDNWKIVNRPSMKNHKMFRSPVVFVHALKKKANQVVNSEEFTFMYDAF